MMKKQYQCVDCPKLIFRAYDIRGIVDQEMNADVYFTLGFAIAELMKASGDMNVCVARDGRLSSEEYLSALEQGLLANGAQPTRVGMLPTPLMYYTCAEKGFLHGLMITGSHNPKNYNGLKIILNGYTLKEEGISAIFDLITKLDKTVFMMNPEPSIEDIDVVTDYMNYIGNHVNLSRPLKVVFDYGNGVGAAIGPKLFEQLGCELINLNDTIDGHFPAHHPDPTIAENLVQLQQALKDNNADVGIAFDGDADRLGVVAPNGEIIWPDRLMMIFSQALLKKKPNAKIVYDVKCSRQLPLFIEQLGGHEIMSPTGHSLVKNLMKITHADLAGEMSGHIFFQDQWFGFDDGVYSACRFLEILSQYPSMDALLATLPRKLASTPELKIYIAEDKKFNFITQFKAKARFDNAKRIDIDGLRVEYDNAWGLIRASNTSPNLIIRFEGNTAADLANIEQQFREEIRKIDDQLELPF